MPADAQELADLDTEENSHRPGRAPPADGVTLPALDPADGRLVNSQEFPHLLHREPAFNPDAADAEADERIQVKRDFDMAAVITEKIQMGLQQREPAERIPA